jgi:flagellar hook-associated protein 3 FlgL
MRISSASLHATALIAMQQQQLALSKLQNQVALGKRVQTPADDPIAAVHILELQRALQEAEQYKANSTSVSNRLALEEQALRDVGDVLSRVQTLAVQANNAPVGFEDRKMIVAELRTRLDELMSIANRKDAGGEYLFGGYSTGTQPFSRSNAGIQYYGDQGSRMLQISATQRVADSHSGYDVFLNVPEGNGTFVLGASATNAGEGTLGAGTVMNRGAWIPDDYTLEFTSATGDYRILDGNGDEVTTGTYTNGSAIEFRGVKVEMTGMPAENDTFTISRSRTEDVFTTLSNLIDTLSDDSVSNSAQFHSAMAVTMSQLERAADHILQVRAEVGARMSGLDAAEAAREDQIVELSRVKSELEDLDYADALTRMNQKLVGLQAAQASYMQISQLSLFNYLR